MSVARVGVTPALLGPRVPSATPRGCSEGVTGVTGALLAGTPSAGGGLPLEVPASTARPGPRPPPRVTAGRSRGAPGPAGWR